MRTHRDKLDAIAEALLLHEEIDRAEVEKLMAGVPVSELRPEPPKPPAAVPAATPEPAARSRAPRPSRASRSGGRSC